MFAAAKGDAETVAVLLAAGADLRANPRQPNTPLRMAILSGDTPTCRLLLQRGADPNVADSNGSTPLTLAIDKVLEVLNNQPLDSRAALPGDLAICKLLLDNKADVNAPAIYSSYNQKYYNSPLSVSPLMKAFKPLHRDLIRLLLANHANPNVSDTDGNTPLMMATGDVIRNSGNSEFCRMLIEAGADVNARNNDGRTALFNAARVEIAAMLIDHKADVNIEAPAPGRKARPETAASLAEQSHNFVVLALLLKAGAHLSQQLPPLHVAALRNDPDQLRKLIAAHAPVNARDRFGLTALHWAVLTGSLEAASLLLENRADVESKDRTGRTPLMWAADTASSKLLLDHGARVNTRDQEGFTPLMHAVIANRAALVELLLSRGADIEAKSNRGADVFELVTVSESKGFSGPEISAMDGIKRMLLAHGHRR